MKHFIIESDCIMGFEPYFAELDCKGMIKVASINHTTKEIRPTHGYFAPHKYGKRLKKYAESIGYTFIN